MHELSLAHSIGEIALDTAREHSSKGDQANEVPLVVGLVRVRVGDLAGVDPEALAFCFEVVRGEWVETAAAALEIQRCPARVRCLRCLHESELSVDPLADRAGCPKCGGDRQDVIGGRELEVFGIELIAQELTAQESVPQESMPQESIPQE
jgi:hydrogenase nickel incorporation protein HypA/HybF